MQYKDRVCLLLGAKSKEMSCHIDNLDKQKREIDSLINIANALDLEKDKEIKAGINELKIANGVIKFLMKTMKAALSVTGMAISILK